MYFFLSDQKKINFFEKYDLKKNKTNNEYVGDTDVEKYTSVKHIWVKKSMNKQVLKMHEMLFKLNFSTENLPSLFRSCKYQTLTNS